MLRDGPPRTTSVGRWVVTDNHWPMSFGATFLDAISRSDLNDIEEFLRETMPDVLVAFGSVSGYVKRYEIRHLLDDWNKSVGLAVVFEYEADRIAFLLRWGDLDAA